MTTMSVVGECFFWYRLTRVVPDKFHRAVKRLCVCVCCCTASCTTSCTTNQTNGVWADAAYDVCQHSAWSCVYSEVVDCV